jgi:hypothetical protein
MKNSRNIKLEISSNYGFDHNWTLYVDHKKFYLGQDIKFCNRVLGISPKNLVEKLGFNDLRNEANQIKLAKFIVNELKLTKKTVKNLETWSICAQ